MKNHIVVTGATGNTGQIVADELKRLKVPFVAMARSEKNRRKLAERGIESVLGDFDDPASLVKALQGAEKAYLVCTPDHHVGPRETAFVRAAEKARVRHVVKCSAYWAGLDAPTGNLRAHGRIERALTDSGMEYTILRPHAFMQTFTLMSWDTIQKAGVVSFPGGDGAMPMVDVRDVAKVAVKALTEKGHAGKAYDLTGPEMVNFHQVAEILTRVLGRPIKYIPGNETAFLGVLMVMGVTPTAREHVFKIARLQRQHNMGKVESTFRDLGITPTTYEQFAGDLVAGRTGGGNSFEPPDTLLFKLVSAVMPVMMRLALRFKRA
jgi:uncharacterized protein YbjT (DUF2867 family)